MNATASGPAGGAVRLGLRENLGQFALLVVVNAFVAGYLAVAASALATGWMTAFASFAIGAVFLGVGTAMPAQLRSVRSGGDADSRRNQTGLVASTIHRR